MAPRIKEGNYIVIQDWMVTEENLSGNDLILYALIYGFSQDGVSEFRGGIRYIQKWLKCKSVGTVENVISRLEQDGYISVTRKKGQTNRYVAHRLHGRTPTVPNSRTPTVPNSRTPTVPNSRTPTVPNSRTNNTNNKLTNINKYINSEYKLLSDSWNTIPNVTKVESLLDARIRLIDRILKDYTVDDILEAFEHVKKSDFLQGSNSYGFVADFDWVINPKNFYKVLEGTYDRKKKKGTGFSNFTERDYDIKDMEKQLIEKEFEDFDPDEAIASLI